MYSKTQSQDELEPLKVCEQSFGVGRQEESDMTQPLRSVSPQRGDFEWAPAEKPALFALFQKQMSDRGAAD